MKRCPFCLKSYKKLTVEHVFPKSWYPDSLLSTEKWKVFSCNACNSRFGKMEKDLLIKMGMCLDPENPLTTSIVNKALRSLNPEKAHNYRDKLARIKEAQVILGEVFPLSNMNTKPFPGFGYHTGFPNEVQLGISIPSYLKVISEKFIRGVEYYLDGRFVEEGQELRIYFCDKEQVKRVSELIRSTGRYYNISPGIDFYRMHFKGYVLYEFKIWDKLIIYGSIFL